MNNYSPSHTVKQLTLPASPSNTPQSVDGCLEDTLCPPSCVILLVNHGYNVLSLLMPAHATQIRSESSWHFRCKWPGI